MKVYELHREQFLPISVDEAWQFFSAASNLSKITPPGMGFEILSAPEKKPIYTGMLINYIVRPLLGIPLRWTTQILDVDAPHKFVDKQMKGPYSLWEHTHTFVPVAGGVQMNDHVRYALPLGWLGILGHTLVVDNKLKEIFSFREKTLKQLFGEHKHSSYVAG